MSSQPSHFPPPNVARLAWATPRTARRGAALAEALVAAFVLAVGVLATAGTVAGASRDVGRARAVDAATELVSERLVRWQASPCVAAGGERVVGPLRERWRVEIAGGLALLADTVTSAAALPTPRVGVVAIAGCGP